MTVTRGLYTHFKGGRYRVHGIGLQVDGEQEVEVVIYEDVAGKPGRFFVRSVANFTEHVVRDGYDGPRFLRGWF